MSKILDIKQKLQAFKKDNEKKGAKLWKVTVEMDVFYSGPIRESKYVTSCHNADAEDVMRWWDKTYWDIATDGYGPNGKLGDEWNLGAPKCIAVVPYEPETRDWIIMPTLKK